MPHSRHRHRKESHQPHHHPIAKKPKRKATPIIVFLGAVFGLLVAAIASESNLVWMAVGVVIGAFAGFLIGRNIDKVANGK